MCVVIDADTFNEFLSSEDFHPIKKWVEDDGHKVIYGGSKYGREIENNIGFRRYLRGIEPTGKTKHLIDADVDKLQDFLSGSFSHKDFNDHHIVSILFISGIGLVCSHDHGFHELLKVCCGNPGKNKILKEAPVVVKIADVKIYQTAKDHKGLLKNKDILRCCKK